MNTPVDAIPPAPRHVTIAVQSLAGSSQSLVTAALDLLAGRDAYEEKRSSILWFEDKKAPSGFRVIGSYTLLTSRSIAQLQQMLREIEANLGNSPQLLKIEMLWVENAHVDVPGLKLPNPIILKERWGIDSFIASGEDAVADACEQGREDKSWCHAVGKAAHKPDYTVFETAVYTWLGGEYKDGNLECWAYAHAHDEEIVGNAVDALLAADVAHRKLEAGTVHDIRRIALDAREVVLNRRADEVFPIEVPASGKIEDKVAAWVGAVSAKGLQDRILMKRAVVFAIGPAAIRGAIVGARLPAGVAPAPIVPVTLVEVIPGGGAPEEPPAFSISLRVQSPKLPH